MADIRVNVNGDASGAVEALGSTAEATGKATEKFRLLSQGVQAAARVALDFAKDSIRAYAESEKVTRQLERATGDLSKAFEKQAQALAKKNAVDDDLIKKQQTMLAQWGAAPKDIEATTQAILDYAAATGKDAVSATQELMTSVENGGGSLKKLGVHFEATGKRTEDLRRAVDALSKKFGGASEANADTLQGRIDGVSLAFEDLQKSFGGVIDDMDRSLGVLDKVKWFLGSITQGIAAASAGMGALAKGLTDPSSWLDQGPTTAFYNAAVGSVALSQYQGYTSAATAGWTNSSLGSKPIGGGSDTTNFGRRNEGGGVEGYGEIREDQDAHVKAWEKWREAQAAAAKKAMDKLAKDISEHSDDAWSAVQKGESDIAGLLGAVVGDMDKQSAELSAQFEATGQQLGAAFIGALTSELEKMGEGGEFDIGAFIAGLLPMIGGLFGPLGAAIGGLAGMGLRMATRKRSHDGSWIGAPRFHSGGWPGIGVDEQPAILQSGERVLSRGEVSAMGGPAGVERAARGGGRGGVTVNISALDTKSTREFLEDRGGQGFQDAIRSGRGDLARLFGAGTVYG